MSRQNLLILILTVMSAVLFLTMGVDKSRAKSHGRRIPEARLFLLAFLGGAVGGTLGMWVFRHKTRHWYFAVGFPFLAAIQLYALAAVLLYSL